MPVNSNNTIPEKISHIHLMAICGTGMGALAALLKDEGFRVTGSDQNVYPPMSTFLAEKGIEVSQGFDPDRILKEKPDLVIVGNAIRRENPEAEALFTGNIPYCSMPQALNHFLVGKRKAIVIAGTHGKTTTSALMAWVLECAGLSPGFMIGGILQNFSANTRMGHGPYVVLEGDEYDTAFFDKGSKFLHFRPHRALLTGIEFDHADIFKDLAQVESAFEGLIRRIPEDGLLIASRDSDSVHKLLKDTGFAQDRLVFFGKEKGSGWSASDPEIHELTEIFSVFHDGNFFGRFESRIPGEHNRMNILAVCAAAASLGISSEEISPAIASFSGVKRRQELRGTVNGISVVDDFAHHPTAVLETLKAMKPHAKGRLIAVFEPRTNTSMRKVFQEAYAQSFGLADLVCIREVPMPEKVPPEERFSVPALVKNLKEQGLSAEDFKDAGEIIAFLKKEARPQDLILVMSNGGFENIHERLLEALEK